MLNIGTKAPEFVLKDQNNEIHHLSDYQGQKVLLYFYPKDYSFSGKRVKRGLYRTRSGKTINADINGALNILKKSSVVDLSVLYSRGDVDTPVRVRLS